MLTAAFICVCGAALLGTALAVVYLRADVTMPWPIAALHGCLGLGGFGCLIIALRGPPRGLQQGMGSFGMISAILIALAALVGGWILTRRLRRGPRSAGALIGVHATLAVSGLVILAAYLLA